MPEGASRPLAQAVRPQAPSLPSPASGGGENGAGGGELTLTTVIETLSTLGKAQLPQQLARWLDALDETGRWALIKLVTGGLRVGVSARLAKTAAAALSGTDAQDIELLWPGLLRRLISTCSPGSKAGRSLWRSSDPVLSPAADAGARAR